MGVSVLDLFEALETSGKSSFDKLFKCENLEIKAKFQSVQTLQTRKYFIPFVAKSVCLNPICS